MDVAVGRPNETAPGIYVWPWRIVPRTENRNLLPHQETVRGVFNFRMSCLLLITPADTLETVAKLDLAAQAIEENPILEDAGGRLRVMLDTTGTEDLAALFSAAHLQLTLCLPLVLERHLPRNGHQLL